MKNNVISSMKFNFEDQLNNPKNKIKKESSFHEVAQEFESLFVFQMLKNARQAKLADNILSNKGSETYQSLLDQEFSKLIAKGQNFGIAEALIKQFGKHWSTK
tara:strand:- start:305 stop:613 length:309 start_codon:yes stop_codon:yes gene_type:complete